MALLHVLEDATVYECLIVIVFAEDIVEGIQGAGDQHEICELARLD